jgi:hypothetical protein
VVLVTHERVLAAIADRTVHVAPLVRDVLTDVPTGAASPQAAIAGPSLPDAAVVGVPASITDTDRSPVGIGATDPGRR